MMLNWIQLQYGLQSQLTLPATATAKPETVIIVGYSYNAQGRADGVNVRGRNGQVKHIDWMTLSILKMERSA